MTEEAMMGLARLKTPGGEDLIVLSKADYDRLVEDSEMLADIAAYDEARREVREAGAEFIPMAMVDRMIAGDNPVRVWREHRGLSLAELAQKTGLSAAYLSQIETGARKGPIRTMRALADALDVVLDDIT